MEGKEGTVYKITERSDETTHALEEGTLVVCTDIIRIHNEDLEFVQYEYWMETIDGKIQVLYDGEFEDTEQPTE